MKQIFQVGKFASLFSFKATALVYLIGAFFGGLNLLEWWWVGKFIILMLWSIAMICCVVGAVALTEYMNDKKVTEMEENLSRLQELSDDIDRLEYNKEKLVEEIAELEDKKAYVTEQD